MPCRLPADDAYPIGHFGSRMWAAPRACTAWDCRIGTASACRPFPAFTTISRFPFPLANEAYFGLIRNFRRQSWLLLYLFGASPAVCSSFVDGRAHELQRLSEDTLYLPYATSLRMGDSAIRATRNPRSGELTTIWKVTRRRCRTR